MQGKEVKVPIKKKSRKHLSRPAPVKDIGLRNAIQIILDRNKMTVTQLAREIDEAQSSVSQVITGERWTRRIIEKIIHCLKLDKDIFFTRTRGDIEKMRDGYILALQTKEETAERRRKQAESVERFRKFKGKLLAQ